MEKPTGKAWLFLLIMAIPLLLVCSKDSNPVKPPTLLAPMLVVPLNNAAGQTLPLKLKWTMVENAAMYELQISMSTAFSTIVQDDSTLIADSTSVTGLAGGTTYYWRVHARNNGDTGNWSGTWSFSTMQDPSLGAPALYTPVNGATDLSLDLLLVWTMVSGAAVYELQIAKNDSFTNIVCWDSTLTAAFKIVAGLSSSTEYYWRVRAKNANTISAWSTVASFSTILPSAPVIIIDPVYAVIIGGAAGRVTGTIVSDSIITSVTMKVLNSYGTDVSSNFAVSSASAYFGRAHVDLQADMNTTIEAKSTAPAGTYKFSITAGSGDRSGTTTVEFAVTGTAGTPVTTGTVIIGSYNNPSVGASTDLDNGVVLLAPAATATASGVDLVGTYSTSKGAMRIFTPLYACDNSGIAAFSVWPDAAATGIVMAPGMAFSAITTVEQIEPLYTAGTPAVSWSCSTGDVFVVKTDQNKYVAIEIVAFDQTITGTCTIKYAK